MLKNDTADIHQKRDNLDFALSFDNQDIPTVTNHKHLGLTLSKDLHFMSTFITLYAQSTPSSDQFTQ